ncbi:hypothetical protein RvY_04605 [Ramazzottius varieornatus]|uniref:Chitin-binding type-2 domain-containing protein n=1 Tax=Ramazzottius varieornatus TaxID=947166 RepID=A0A1D1US67_RAMVA|nr:hypothetical protein RvY_04605 [Ramazzottius varieornatus]
MRSFVLLATLMVCAAAQRQQYVWDLLKPSLDASQVTDLLLNAQPGVSYPNYDTIPQTNFQCPQQPGFYADVNAQCQVFHRCDINGNQTSYLCVSSTVFNQITLVCDYFWNVDCQSSQQYANFANSRLYTDQQLFDTPPADYVAPSQLLAQQQQEQLNGQATQSQNQITQQQVNVQPQRSQPQRTQVSSQNQRVTARRTNVQSTQTQPTTTQRAAPQRNQQNFRRLGRVVNQSG